MHSLPITLVTRGDKETLKRDGEGAKEIFKEGYRLHIHEGAGWRHVAVESSIIRAAKINWDDTIASRSPSSLKVAVH